MKNKIPLIIISVAIILFLGMLFLGSNRKGSGAVGGNNTEENVGTINNVVEKDGVQYITISAKGGYSPRITTAKAGIPTKLIVKTNGTYDCSAALRIGSIGFQKILKNTGEEVIDLGTPTSGPLDGVCGMGMYNFSVNFQ